MPFLNSMILCPKDLATEGNRLLNNSSTINRSMSNFQIRMPARKGLRAAGKKSGQHVFRPDPHVHTQFYKLGGGRQTHEIGPAKQQ